MKETSAHLIQQLGVIASGMQPPIDRLVILADEVHARLYEGFGFEKIKGFSPTPEGSAYSVKTDIFLKKVIAKDFPKETRTLNLDGQVWLNF